SPDYACNFKGAEYSGIVNGDLEAQYRSALSQLINETPKQVLIFGDRGILPEDRSNEVVSAITRVPFSIGFFTDAESKLTKNTKLVFAVRSILEKAGLLINRQERLQYSDKVIDFPDNTEPEWRVVAQISQQFGVKLSQAMTDRDRTIEFLA